jgi:hypothetical protein
MANRNLTSDQLILARALLDEIRGRLVALAGDDQSLLFAYRRKIFKELGYDERGTPAERKKIKCAKWGLQNGKCAHCGEELPLKNSELDRKNAEEGYTLENTDLVHAHCHDARQAVNNYH